jgi:hypothetical protein
MDSDLEEYIGNMVNDVRATKRPVQLRNINAIAEVSKRLVNGKKRA